MKKSNLIVAWLCCLLYGSVLAQPIELPAYGFGDLSTIPVTQSFIHENHIGDAPLESILNYRNDDKYWTIARSVGMLEILFVKGNDEIRTACTATLISEDMILTNAHCIPGDKPNARAVAANLHMGYDQQGLDSTSYPVNIQPLDSNKDLDYSILSVSNSPGERFGFVTLNMRPANPNERLFIIQHAEGLPKRISRNCGFFRDSPIRSINLRHRCDTRGGSSGSLVFSENDGSVIGLHFASSFREENPPPPAERYNMAKRLDKIFEFSSYLPERISALPTQGYLNVSSTPSGATVKLDGQTIGRTPLQSYAHAIGTYQLSLSYNGYLNHNESIRITANQALQRSINLRLEAAQRGALSISSSPSGATVALDGRVIGSTPLQNYAYDAGDYQLSLRYNGYQTYSESIRISANSLFQRSINLQAVAPAPTPVAPVPPPSQPNTALITTSEELVRRAAQGGRLELAAVTFRLSETLELRGNVQLIGQGYERTRIVSSAPEAVVRYSGGGTLTTQGIGFAYAGEHNSYVMVIEDGVVDIDGCEFTGGNRIEDAPARSGGSGLWLSGNSSGTIRNSFFHNNDLNGLQMTEHVQTELSSNMMYGNKGSGIAFGGSAGGIATNNKSFDNDYHGIIYRGTSGGNAVGNEIFGNYYHGILLTDSAEPTLENNSLHDNSSGIHYINTAKGIAIANESFDNKHHGILLAGNAEPTLENNRLHDNGASGITYFGDTQGLAVGNEIFDNGSSGVYISDNAQPQLEQNRIHDNQASGIFYKDSATGSAVGNEIFANKHDGIAVWDNAKPQLEQNRIHSNQASGISYKDSAAGSVVGNEIFSNDGAGIYVRNYTEPQLEQNRIYDNQASGIFYQSSAAGSASNNQIYNNGLNPSWDGAGIALRDSANPTLSNNTFYGNRQGAIVDER